MAKKEKYDWFTSIALEHIQTAIDDDENVTPEDVVENNVGEVADEFEDASREEIEELLEDWDDDDAEDSAERMIEENMSPEDVENISNKISTEHVIELTHQALVMVADNFEDDDE
jgi:hypothetical protein